MDSSSDTSYESLVDMEQSAAELDVKERILILRHEMTVTKSEFSRLRYKVLFLLEGDLTHPERIQLAVDEMTGMHKKVETVVTKLCVEYRNIRDIESFNRLVIEAEEMSKLSEHCQQTALVTFSKDRPKEELSAGSVEQYNHLEQLREELRKTESDIKERKRQLAEEHQIRVDKMDTVLEQAKKCVQAAEQELTVGLDSRRGQRQESPHLQKKAQMKESSRYAEFEHSGERSLTDQSTDIGRDWWYQLKRISIPVFTGDKSTYESWKAAFMACIDRAPASPEYKLLQLRQYVSGDAISCIEKLGHSAAAYEAAKERLERRFGGKRRQVASCLEDLKAFSPLSDDRPEDIASFGDLVDLGVLNMKEYGMTVELGSGWVYMMLQKKLSQKMLASYHRWVFECEKAESVETLREWLLKEADYHTIALETVHGLGVYCNRGGSRSSWKSHGNQCVVCTKDHEVEECDHFIDKTVKERWESARMYGLCFRCLQRNHIGRVCTQNRLCGINNCQHNHHKLLHSM